MRNDGLPLAHRWSSVCDAGPTIYWRWATTDVYGPVASTRPSTTLPSTLMSWPSQCQGSCNVYHVYGKPALVQIIRTKKMKWNESGFRPPLCTYRLNWARRTSWGWWDDWDDTVLQTQGSKFEPWRSEAEHATSRSRRLPAILTFTRGWGRNIFCFFQTAETGNRTPNSGVKGSGANHYPRAPAHFPGNEVFFQHLCRGQVNARGRAMFIMFMVNRLWCKLSGQITAKMHGIFNNDINNAVSAAKKFVKFHI